MVTINMAMYTIIILTVIFCKINFVEIDIDEMLVGW